MPEEVGHPVVSDSSVMIDAIEAQSAIKDVVLDLAGFNTPKLAIPGLEIIFAVGTFCVL